MLNRFHVILCLSALFICVSLPGPFSSDSKAQDRDDITPPTFSIVYPNIDPIRGKQLFVQRNCILCHSVNGVGGNIGPALDADDNTRAVDLLGFAARMWRGSSAVIKLQESAFDYQIDLEGYEIGDIAAFAYDLETQKSLVTDDLPPEVNKRISDLSTAVENGLFEE